MTAVRRLLLMRHGLPDYCGGKPGDEPPGPSLSEIGHQQAAHAATVLPKFAPVLIHTSPLARARQTAERIGQVLGLPVRSDSELREWHRTEALHEVSVRLARWLVHWLRGSEPCAVVVSHASPLLAILRSALYLPHVGWWKTGHPHRIEISSGDQFEVSMASVFELVIEPRCVTARCLFHPHPRIHHYQHGVPRERLPRPVLGTRENRFLRRPNWLHLLGYRPGTPPT
jgi:broad specificity phosphatase PhoE